MYKRMYTYICVSVEFVVMEFVHISTCLPHCVSASVCSYVCKAAACVHLYGLAPLQPVLVMVFILPSISAKTLYTCTCSGHHLQLAMVVFFLHQLAHLLRCTHDLSCCHRALQLALAVVFLYQPGIY